MADLLPRRPDANRSARDQATRSNRVAVRDTRWNSGPCLRLESRRKNLQSSAASRRRNRNRRRIELAGTTRSLRVVVLVPSRGTAGIPGPRPIFVCFAGLDLHDARVDRPSSSVSFSGYGLVRVSFDAQLAPVRMASWPGIPRRTGRRFRNAGAVLAGRAAKNCRCQRCRGSWLAVVPAEIWLPVGLPFSPEFRDCGHTARGFQSMPAKEYRQ